MVDDSRLYLLFESRVQFSLTGPTDVHGISIVYFEPFCEFFKKESFFYCNRLKEFMSDIQTHQQPIITIDDPRISTPYPELHVPVEVYQGYPNYQAASVNTSSLGRWC